MIPDGTPPDAIILVIALTTLVGCALMVGLFWYRFPETFSRIMSRSGGGGGDVAAGAERVRHQAPELVQVSAMRKPDDTEPVPSVAGAGALDTAARDIIRAALIAELLDEGIITNRDKAICQAFRCSKAASTRPDAPFQVALRLVEQHRKKLSGPEFRELNDQRRPAALDQPA